MKKRTTSTQISREEPDDRDEPIDPVRKADESVLARRKYVKT